MRLIYILKEAISGFRKAKLSSFASTFAIAAAMMAIVAFSVGVYNLDRLVKSIKSRVEIEVFLKDGLSDGEVKSLRRRIERISGVEGVIFISKKEAAEIFKREFGEDIFDVLDFNPLPASFKVKLKPGYRSYAKVKEISNTISKFSGVDEVKYRKVFLRFLDRRYRLAVKVFFVLGVAILFVSFLLVVNTIRLTIYAKRKVIQIMQLVGATRMFIMLPFLIQGFVQGLIAGVFAGGVSYVLIEIFLKNVPDDMLSKIDMPDWFYLALVGFSCFIGLSGSWFSARKHIKYKVI